MSSTENPLNALAFSNMGDLSYLPVLAVSFPARSYGARSTAARSVPSM
jgi:hypothetical protein